jgi:hypothetical protein
MDRCYVCNRPVIGLLGQDVVLDAEMLMWRKAPQQAINEIIDSRADGPVHVTCFRSSDRRAFWFSWLQAGYADLHPIDENTFVFIPRIGATRASAKSEDYVNVLTTDCVSFRLVRSQINSATTTDGGYLVPTQSKIGFDLRDVEPGLAKSLRRLANRPGSIVELLDLLDVRDRLVRLDSVVEATLGPIEATSDYVRFLADYSIFAPEALFAYCDSIGRPRAARQK